MTLETLREAETRVRGYLNDRDADPKFPLCRFTSEVDITDKATGIEFVFAGWRRKDRLRAIQVARVKDDNVRWKFKPKDGCGTFLNQ